MSRSAMSMTTRPAASAASRATLPALCPWRTIQSVLGQEGVMGAGASGGLEAQLLHRRVERDRAACVPFPGRVAGIQALVRGGHSPVVPALELGQFVPAHRDRD